jgi:hypothetical protein
VRGAVDDINLYCLRAEEQLLVVNPADRLKG